MMAIGPGMGLLNRRRRAAAASYPLLDSLVAYWNLSEASGQRNDSHTNGLHLTDNNTVGVSSGGGPDGGDAASFVAANSEYLSRASETALQFGASVTGTFAAWVYLSSLNTTRSIIAKRANTEFDYFLRVRSTNTFEFFVSDNGSTLTSVSIASPAINTWYFLCAGYDGSQIWISVDGGTPATTTFNADVYAGAHQFDIGAFGAGIEPWDGLLAYAGFWKRTLTAAERTWLYNSGSGRNYAAVAAYTG